MTEQVEWQRVWDIYNISKGRTRFSHDILDWACREGGKAVRDIEVIAGQGDEIIVRIGKTQPFSLSRSDAERLVMMLLEACRKAMA